MPDGLSFRLSEQRGKVVLVNFWATWCPPCLEEMPAMERLWRRHKDAGFVLVAISLDADPKKVPPFVSARKFSFPVALDPKMAVAEKYGVRALPSSFVIDRQGLMAGVALGPRSWDDSAAHGLVQAMLR
jgi:peroxiredoxin